MRTGSRTRRGAGLTLIEVVITILVIAFLAGMLLPALQRGRDEAGSPRCKWHLNYLARGMATYLNEYGDNRWFPCPLGRGMSPGTYNGAEWLASLYWTGVVTDPTYFICPSSSDDNDDGRQFGLDRAIPGLFGSQTVSYAGMHYGSNPDEPGAIRDDYPPTQPMASDDTQGDINHGMATNGCMFILFFDSHVECRTNTDLDLERQVGKQGGLLAELAN